MKFYTWIQNNSHGRYLGPAQFVCIQAADLDTARAKAEGLGLYFDGEGDCPTCGDRWHEDPHEIADEPTLYDKPLREEAGKCFGPGEWLIVYADGREERS